MEIGTRVVTAGRYGSKGASFRLPNGERAWRPLYAIKEYVVVEVNDGSRRFVLSGFCGRPCFSPDKAARLAADYACQKHLPFLHGVVQWQVAFTAPVHTSTTPPPRPIKNFELFWGSVE